MLRIQEYKKLRKPEKSEIASRKMAIEVAHD